MSLRPKKEHPNQVTVEGVFRANKNGFGFLHVDDNEDDMFIGRNDVGHAIDGDTVAVVIKKPADRLRGTAAEARVVEIVERSLKTVVGKFILSDEKEPYAGYIKSKNQKIQQPIYIKKEPVALDGTEIIKVDIEKYPNRHYDYLTLLVTREILVLMSWKSWNQWILFQSFQRMSWLKQKLCQMHLVRKT